MAVDPIGSISAEVEVGVMDIQGFRAPKPKLEGSRFKKGGLKMFFNHTEKYQVLTIVLKLRWEAVNPFIISREIH